MACEDAVVALAVDDQYRRIPVAYELVGGVSEGTLSDCIVLLPGSTTHIPVGEPHLLGRHVLHLEIEDTSVGDEGLEALLVHACQIEDGVAAVAGPDAAEALAIDPRLLLQLIDCGEVVLDILPRVVAADLLVPCLTEAGDAVSIGSDDDIALLSHEAHIPAVREELTDGALWATLAKEQRRVLLRLVEVRWEDDPDEHVAPVGRLDPALLYRDRSEAVECGLILCRELLRCTRLDVYEVEIRGIDVALTASEDLTALHIQRGVVVHTRGDLADLTSLERDLPELGFGMLRREEEDALAIGSPLELIDIVLEAAGEEGLLSRLQILDEETLEVGFVAVTLHADPADALAIG